LLGLIGLLARRRQAGLVDLSFDLILNVLIDTFFLIGLISWIRELGASAHKRLGHISRDCPDRK
jgi:hypothetical protein